MSETSHSPLHSRRSYDPWSRGKKECRALNREALDRNREIGGDGCRIRLILKSRSDRAVPMRAQSNGQACCTGDGDDDGRFLRG